jgi:hypothetical protein
MKNETVIIGGAILLWFLLKPKKPNDIVLTNNAVLAAGDDEGRNYKATIYSSHPIKASLLNKQGNQFNIKLDVSTYDDYIQSSLPKENEAPLNKGLGAIGNSLPYVF